MGFPALIWEGFSFCWVWFNFIAQFEDVRGKLLCCFWFTRWGSVLYGFYGLKFLAFVKLGFSLFGSIGVVVRFLVLRLVLEHFIAQKVKRKKKKNRNEKKIALLFLAV